jgi:phosphoglycolate phosphatase-like HAD superfamily hydrolase
VPGTFITFDLDGTLEDSRPDMVASVGRVRAALGLDPWPYRAIVPHVNKGMTHLYQVCFEEVVAGAGPGAAAYDDVKARYEADYAAHIADDTTLYDGIPEALSALGERATLAVATNKPERLSRLLLDALGIGGHFAAVVGGDTASAPKPSAVVMTAALEQAGVERGALDALFHVGDTAGDMKLATNAGVTGVWAAWGYVDKPGDEQPDRTAPAPADLLSVIFPG